MQVEPPKLRDLIGRCARLGYAEPEILIGDMPVDEGSRVPAVRVQLHSNELGLRNVVATCRVLPGPAQSMERLAVRSALAEALDLAGTPEALPVI